MSTLEKIIIGIIWGAFTFVLGWVAGGHWLIGVAGVFFCTVVPLGMIWDTM